MHTFVSADELIGKCQTWHEASFFEPEDRAETTAEEDAFNASEGYESGGESATVSYPLEGPFGFLSDCWDVLDGVE